MLDLKAKLAAAGLVTQQDIDRLEKSKAKKKRRTSGKGKSQDQGQSNLGVRLSVRTLKDRPKGEQYDAVRRFVDKVRVDPIGQTPSENAQTYHFATAKGQVGRLVLEPDVIEQLKSGKVGIIAFMSNHGLAHAAVPAEAARAVAELRPLWLRVLSGHPQAGQLEPPTS